MQSYFLYYNSCVYPSMKMAGPHTRLEHTRDARLSMSRIPLSGVIECLRREGTNQRIIASASVNGTHRVLSRSH